MSSNPIFISHAPADLGWVNGFLGAFLEQAKLGWTAESKFAPGEAHFSALKAAIDQAHFILIVVSPAYIDTDWQRFEPVIADILYGEVKRARIIPILRTEIELPRALQGLVAIDFADPSKTLSEQQRLYKYLTAKPPSCPYPGLRAFEERDSQYFFGRARELDFLKNQLRRHNFFAVIGASGSGKSSLVQAGLPVTLRSSALWNDPWIVLVMRPRMHPLEELRHALKNLTGAETNVPANLDLGETLKSRNLLLVVDALEEEWTLTRSDQDRAEFERALLQLQQNTNIYIVVTLRSDFYSQFESSLLRDEILAHQMRLAPLDNVGLREAIREPARQVEVTIEDALVERLVSDAARSDGASVLPLVQETLVRLWDLGLAQQFLPLSAYETLPGGLDGILAEHAEQTYAELVTTEKKEIARRILLQLVQINDLQFGSSGTRPTLPDTRRPASIQDLQSRFVNQALFKQTLDALAGNRLVNLDEGRENGDTQIDLAHERLMDKWPRYAEWIAASRDALSREQILARDADEWARHQRASSYLYRGDQLREINEWVQSHIDEFNLREREFLQASRAAAQRKRFLFLGVGFGIFILFVSFLVMLIFEMPPFFQRRTEWIRVAALPAEEASVVRQDRAGSLYAGFGSSAGLTTGDASLYKGVFDAVSGDWEWLPLKIQKGRPRDILPDPQIDTYLYVVFEKAGLWRTRDGGNSWEEIGGDAQLEDIVSLAASPNGTLFAADRQKGIFASRDFGDTWQPLSAAAETFHPEPWIVSANFMEGRLQVVTGPAPAASRANPKIWELEANAWRFYESGVPVSFAVRSADSLYAGGQALVMVSPFRVLIPKTDVSALDITRDKPPKIIVGTFDGEVMIVDSQSGAVLYHDAKERFGNSGQTHHVLADAARAQRFWAATDTGLYCGQIVRWFESAQC